MRGYHPNGKREREGKYSKDERVGMWIFYRKDGTKLEESELVAGKREGRVTRWHPNGVKDFDGQYKAGKKTGVWKFYEKD